MTLTSRVFGYFGNNRKSVFRINYLQSHQQDLMILFGYFWSTCSLALGLFPNLCSEITPGRFRRLSRVPGIKSRSATGLANTLPAILWLSHLWFFFFCHSSCCPLANIPLWQSVVPFHWFCAFPICGTVSLPWFYWNYSCLLLPESPLLVGLVFLPQLLFCSKFPAEKDPSGRCWLGAGGGHCGGSGIQGHSLYDWGRDSRQDLAV